MWQSLSPMLNEFQRESAITRRVLDRVPADKLTWTPHPKSMTLGKLANHIASVPGGISRIAQNDVHEIDPAAFAPPQPNDKNEILATFEASLKTAEQFIGGLTESTATATWRLNAKGGHEILAMPRVELIRNIMLNHWYHHRGQLSVYLRLLEVPVPSIYGPSADESPFPQPR
jgi:uncharacterized damage-inducible protein DinB